MRNIGFKVLSAARTIDETLSSTAQASVWHMLSLNKPDSAAL